MTVESNIRLISLLETAKKNDPENPLLLELYKRHDKYSPESLVEELRADGSNTIGRVLTGAVDYDEIVKRVADKLKIDKRDVVDDEIENELLIARKAMQDFVKQHPEAEAKLEEAAKKYGVEGKDAIDVLLKGSATAFLAIARGPLSRILWEIAFSIGWEIAIATGKYGVLSAAITVGNVAARAIPFLNIAMGAWMVYDISGPAYRKIIPSVLNIALLRIQASGEASKQEA